MLLEMLNNLHNVAKGEWQSYIYIYIYRKSI